jgi:hypothetical protein
LPGVGHADERLDCGCRRTPARAQPPARVADLACGTSWSSTAIARANPTCWSTRSTSIPSRSKAPTATSPPVSPVRVRTAVHNVSHGALDGSCDLITLFEAPHDMNHPVEALRTARAMLADGGSVVIADEQVAAHFTAPGDEIERFNCGWSVLHCLPIGTASKTRLRRGPQFAQPFAHVRMQAGFARVDVPPVEHDFWRSYRLLP